METKGVNTVEKIDLIALAETGWKVFTRFWWIVVVMGLIGGIGMGLKSTQFFVPMYRAQADFTVMMENRDYSDNYQFYYDTQVADQLAKTFPYILSSSLLTDTIKSDLGVETLNGTISAVSVGQSNLITMSVVSADAEDAYKILDSAIRVYPQVAKSVLGNIVFNIIDAPSVPQEPYNQPSYHSQVKKGIVLGVGIGVVLIVLVALLRKTITDEKQLKSICSLECLGRISLAKSRKNGFISILDTVTEDAFKETVRSMSLKVANRMREHGGKVLLVTSTQASEGKSLIAVNLACSLARHGKRVFLIDGDLRKQDDWKQLKLDCPAVGLQEIVQNGAQWDESACYDENSGVFFIGEKKPVENLHAVLNSERLQETIQKIKEEADYVIIDASPAGMFDDTHLLTKCADFILYVVRHDFVQQQKLLDVLDSLEDSAAPILGFVYNGKDYNASHYAYSYRYNYGETRKQKKHAIQSFSFETRSTGKEEV